MASAEESRKFDVPFDEIRAAVSMVLRDMNATKIEWSPTGLVAEAFIPPGILAIWNKIGWRILVGVEPNGLVYVRSESISWFNLNRDGRNCRNFLSKLERQIGSKSPSNQDGPQH